MLSMHAPFLTRFLGSRLCISQGEFSTLPVVAGVIPSFDFVARFERSVTLQEERSVTLQEAVEACTPGMVAVRVRLSALVDCVPYRLLSAAIRSHRITLSHATRSGDAFRSLVIGHVCDNICEARVCLFTLTPFTNSASRPHVLRVLPALRNPSTPTSEPQSVPIPTSDPPSSLPRAPVSFPPSPLSIPRQAQIVRDWCEATSYANVSERPCAVCARLTSRAHLSEHPELSLPLHCLERPGEFVTRQTRTSSSDAVVELSGPILYPDGIRLVEGVRVLSVCTDCLSPLRAKRVPRFALANGRWIGECPAELQGLRYVEQLLIARNRHSFCVAQVSRGKQRYMTANAIIFGQPVARMYAQLPPLVKISKNV